MSKHTTKPWAIPLRCINSHVLGHTTSHEYDHMGRSDYPCGNWNKHKKRKVPSSMRTAGRRARYERRTVALWRKRDEESRPMYLTHGALE